MSEKRPEILRFLLQLDALKILIKVICAFIKMPDL
jgi:hypothetical protein